MEAGTEKGRAAPDLNSPGGAGVGEERARPWCLPLANLSFGEANTGREGEGRGGKSGERVGLEWGGGTVKPTGRIHTNSQGW